MTHDEQLKIGAAAILGKGNRKNANGQMYAALFDFAYLTAVRARDARSLKRYDVGEREILIEPTKTRHLSGTKIAIVITPDIRDVLERAKALGTVKSLFVFHTLKGPPLQCQRSQVGMAPCAGTGGRQGRLVSRPAAEGIVGRQTSGTLT